MGRIHRPRHGSLQFWPRTRAIKEIPSVNWSNLTDSNVKNNILGFIGYKVGMKSVLVKDNTANSMTKGKSIVLPVTVVECPPIKIYSIRFYKKNQVKGEILADNVDKELKRIVRIPGKNKGKEITDFDDIKLMVYSVVSKTGIKKAPNMSEIGLKGNNATDKLNFAKSLLGKEMNFEEFFDKGQLIDIYGVTKGKGFQGPVKRWHIQFRPHKSEKGVRKVGSIGPWHPAKVSYRVPMAGQTGFNTRVKYNNKIISIGKNLEGNIQHYGLVKNSYCLIKGSISGPAKRAVVFTAASRPTKMTAKENFEFVRVLK